MARVDVAVGLVINQAAEVLVSKRHAHQHQGNLWEFPGGKREAEESRFAALAREIHEEVGLAVHAAEPFLAIEHDYGDKHVLLDVWRVTEFSGEAEGREGQVLQWLPVDALSSLDFPAANLAILEALKKHV